MKPYLYLRGLKRLSDEIVGNEIIHIGIRPYGFHAGNAIALIVYPYLLCKILEDSGKGPKLQFVISINDWEQDALAGPDYRKYPFNIYPQNTSLQFTPDENGCCQSTVDHWQPIIEKSLSKIKNRFPKISLRFVRNSELISNQYCKDLLLATIKSPKDQLKIFEEYSGKETLETPLSYAGAICPKCRTAHGNTSVVKDDLIQWECARCGTMVKNHFEKFQYWWYHKPMLIARIKIFKIDITLSGGDHFSEGDFAIREALIKKYSPTTKRPKMLFTPTVIALNGEKMSKSRKNTAFAKIGKLILAAAKFDGNNLLITKDMISNQIDDRDYSNIF